MKHLFKTTIVIWSEYDTDMRVELVDLAREAVSGDSYCSKMSCVEVEDPQKDPDWDDTEFFNIGDEDEDESSSSE